METVSVEVKIFRVEMLCEEDGCPGRLQVQDEAALLSDPVQFPHKCTNCGKERYIGGQPFPFLRYEDV